jgi:hypothetical protein
LLLGTGVVAEGGMEEDGGMSKNRNDGTVHVCLTRDVAPSPAS